MHANSYILKPNHDCFPSHQIFSSIQMLKNYFLTYIEKSKLENILGMNSFLNMYANIKFTIFVTIAVAQYVYF